MLVGSTLEYYYYFLLLLKVFLVYIFIFIWDRNEMKRRIDVMNDKTEKERKTERVIK